MITRHDNFSNSKSEIILQYSTQRKSHQNSHVVLLHVHNMKTTAINTYHLSFVNSLKRQMMKDLNLGTHAYARTHAKTSNTSCHDTSMTLNKPHNLGGIMHPINYSCSASCVKIKHKHAGAINFINTFMFVCHKQR